MNHFFGSQDFDPLPRMAAIYGMAELCGVGHRKVGPWEIPWGPEISMGKMRSPCIFQRQDETFQHVWYIRHRIFVVNFCYLPSDFLLTHWAPADWHPKICFSSSNVRHGIQSFGPGSLLCRSVEALGTCVVASSFGKIGSGRGLAAKRKDFQVASTTSRSLSWQISSKTLEEATEEWEVPEVEHQKCGKETGLAPMIFIAHFVAA